MRELKKMKVLITGGTAGIGRATALLLAGQGCQITLTGRDENKLSDLMKDAEKAGLQDKIRGELFDLTDKEACADFVERYFKEEGCPDIFINNAALAYDSVLADEEYDLNYLLDTNLWAYLWFSKQIAQRMIDDKVEGDIVNVGSMSAVGREADSSAYVATKSGIQGFSESFRKEINEHNIRVSLIEPGKTGSDMQDTTPEEERDLQAKHEMLKAEDVAQAILFILRQPRRVDIIGLRIKPSRQFI